jgi:ATP-dependent Lon protease
MNTPETPETPGSVPVAAEKPQIPEDVLLIVPVRNLVMFPGAVTQVALGRDISINAAQEAVQHGHKLGIVLQRDPGTDEPGPDDLYRTGTTVSVVRYLKAPNGMHHLICQGEERFRVLDYLPGLPFLAARFDLISEEESRDPAIEARANYLKEKAAEAIGLLPQAPPELAHALKQVESPSALADLVAHRVQVLKLSREIDEQTQEKLDERQREYLLREQLKTIKKELGEDQEHAQTGELRDAIRNANLPPEAQAQAEKELKRLELMPEAAAEYSMLRTYLDWLVRCRGRCSTRKPSTSRKLARFSTRTTTGCRRSSGASSSISQCAS